MLKPIGSISQFSWSFSAIYPFFLLNILMPIVLKIGSRKSLLNVFQNGSCHPKMAMVIDDRLKVWEDKDQPRVHVVPPFTPYYAPQAEVINYAVYKIDN